MLSLECNVPTTSSVLPISREVVRSSLEAQRGRGLPSLASASPPHECEDDIFLVDLGKRSLSVPVLPVLSRCTGRGSCSVCVLWHLGQGSLLPCPACSYSFCVVSSRSESEGMCPPSAFLPPTGAGSCLESFGLEAHGTGSVLWDICVFPLWCRVTERAWLEACVSLANFPGWVGADALQCVFQQVHPVGSPADQLLQEGVGHAAKSSGLAARFWESIWGIESSRPHTLAHCPACSFNMGEAGLSVLAEPSSWSPFWQRMGSVHQDHIPDAGTETLEG